jgi:hypothetical protein
MTEIVLLPFMNYSQAQKQGELSTMLCGHQTSLHLR